MKEILVSFLAIFLVLNVFEMEGAEGEQNKLVIRIYMTRFLVQILQDRWAAGATEVAHAITVPGDGRAGTQHPGAMGSAFGKGGGARRR